MHMHTRSTCDTSQRPVRSAPHPHGPWGTRYARSLRGDLPGWGGIRTIPVAERLVWAEKSPPLSEDLGLGDTSGMYMQHRTYRRRSARAQQLGTLNAGCGAPPSGFCRMNTVITKLSRKKTTAASHTEVECCTSVHCGLRCDGDNKPFPLHHRYTIRARRSSSEFGDTPSALLPRFPTPRQTECVGGWACELTPPGSPT